MHQRTYAVGDLVRYTGAFLHSVGWYTGVPVNGRVTAIGEYLGTRDATRQVLTVEWSDGSTIKTLAGNVLPVGTPDYTNL